MSSVGKLSVEITADIKGLKSKLKQVDQRIDKLSGSTKKSTAAFKKWSSDNVASIAALSAGFVLASKKIIDLSSSFTDITNKLRVATQETGNLAETTQRLFQVSNDTRSGIESTVDLYTKLERSTRNLNISQDRLVKLTGTINKAFAISGATTAEASGAIRQLGQALASGALRGDEFNSVAEQAPVIMEAIKKATGKTAGELRNLAATGAITADVLIKSLEGYSDAIDKDFSLAVATFSQKLEIAKNNAIQFVGANDDMNSSVSKLGDVFVTMSENLDTVLKVAEALALTMAGKLAISFTAAQVEAFAVQRAALAASSGLTVMTASARTAAAALGVAFGAAGIIFTAISALSLFGGSQDEVAVKIAKTNKQLGEQAAKFGKLDEAGRQRALIENQNAIIDLTKQRVIASDELRAATERLNKENSKSQFMQGGTIGLEQAKKAAEERLNILSDELARRKKMQADNATKEVEITRQEEKEKNAIIDLEAENRKKAQQRIDEAEAKRLANKAAADRERRLADDQLFLEDLQLRFDTQVEIENAAYADQVARLQQALDDKSISQTEFFKRADQLRSEHESLTIDAESADRQKRLQNLQTGLAAAASLLQLGGKKAQKIAKAIAKGNALISGAEAAVHAWDKGMQAGGPYLAAAYTALSVAKTAAMIKQIGKSGGGNASAGGGTVPQQRQQPQQQQAPQAQRNISINITGDSQFTTEQVRTLINQINEQTGDGVILSTGG